ncbi:hypothetical protein ACSBR2_031430 [Camellia fascicularis]
MAKHKCSSSSEGSERCAMVDEKMRKRMISNRESARRSRKRREEHIKVLNCQLTMFKNTNIEIVQKINSITQQSMAVEMENQILTRQHNELTKRLESLEIVASYVCGYLQDIPQYDSQPWQVPGQSVPLMASVGMFKF